MSNLDALPEALRRQAVQLQEHAASLRAAAASLSSLTDLGAARVRSEALRDDLASLRKEADAFEVAGLHAKIDADEPFASELRRARAEQDSLRGVVRDASLAAFKTARDAAARERDVLLSSGAASASTSSGHASASASASAASASLRRTRALMAAELSRGGATLSVQAASAGALTQAAGQYDAQRGALATGRGSLSALRRAASADRAILWVGSLLFCGVVTHIGIKRTPFLARLHPARRAAVAARAAERVKWDATREAKAAGRGAAAGTQGDAEAAYQPPPPPPLPPSPPAAPLPEVLQPPPPLDADVLAPPRSLLVSDWGATALLLDDSPFVGAEAADGDPAHILGDAVASENELPLQPEAVHFEL